MKFSNKALGILLQNNKNVMDLLHKYEVEKNDRKEQLYKDIREMFEDTLQEINHKPEFQQALKGMIN